MSKPPAVVVMVNWNLKDSLLATLDSFREVDDWVFQMVVSDNASTDGSPEMVHRPPRFVGQIFQQSLDPCGS
jgi:GT2 family glycosyltransferase